MSIGRFIDIDQHGLKEDLAYISMSVALFKLAQDEHSTDGVVRVEENEDGARKIRYRMDKLINRLDRATNKYNHAHKEIVPLQMYLLKMALQGEYELLQPDYLATYILRFRFVRTKRIIHDEFKWLNAKGSDLLSLLELLDKTPVKDKDDEMCELAHKIANCL